jgi:nitroreductase
MEFQDVVRRRRMVRAFDSRAVDQAIIERLLENALHAPSAGFTQGWGFLVLTAHEDRDRFWSLAWPAEERSGAGREAVMDAPVVIVCYSSKDAYLDRYAEPDKGWKDRDESRWPAPFWDIDAGFAAQLILLTAVDAGLGALFFGLEHHEQVAAAFGVSGDHRAIGAIALGHPAPDEPSPSLRRGRRPVEDVAHFGSW